MHVHKAVTPPPPTHTHIYLKMKTISFKNDAFWYMALKMFKFYKVGGFIHHLPICVVHKEPRLGALSSG